VASAAFAILVRLGKRILSKLRLVGSDFFKHFHRFFPISYIGMETVVNGGSISLSKWLLSNPTTAAIIGDLSTRVAESLIAPIARRSPAAKHSFNLWRSTKHFLHRLLTDRLRRILAFRCRDSPVNSNPASWIACRFRDKSRTFGHSMVH